MAQLYKASTACLAQFGYMPHYNEAPNQLHGLPPNWWHDADLLDIDGLEIYYRLSGKARSGVISTLTKAAVVPARNTYDMCNSLMAQALVETKDYAYVDGFKVPLALTGAKLTAFVLAKLFTLAAFTYVAISRDTINRLERDIALMGRRS